ncbi:MAG: SRPBCC family protein [Ilumatobacteraceae bacterium]
MSSDTASSDTTSVERIIPAPAAAIFALLADPERHRDIDGSGTVREAPGGSQLLTLGSTFGMKMKMGLPYSMVNTVVEFEPDRRIAWQTAKKLGPLGTMGGRIWRYELEPVEGGTLVRETWDISQERVKAAVRPLRTKTIAGMTKTLARIEEIVTAAEA